MFFHQENQTQAKPKHLPGSDVPSQLAEEKAAKLEIEAEVITSGEYVLPRHCLIS